MRRKTILVLVLFIAITGGLFYVWRRPSAVGIEETIETTLAEIARGDTHRVRAVRAELLKDARFATQSRLLDAAAMLANGQPHEALTRTVPFPSDPALRWRFLLIAGKALHAQGRFAEAEPLLQEVTHLRPDEPDALRWLGMVYYDLGAMDHAVGPLQKLAELQADDYRPHWLLGVIYHDFEQYVPAIEHYRSALDRVPAGDLELEIRGGLARSLVANRSYEEALKALLPNPQTALQMQLTAKCYFNLGQPDSARAWASKAAALDPADRDLALLQSELFVAEGKIADGIAVLQQAVERHPHEPALRYQYAQTLRANGQAAEADRQLQIWTEADARRRRMVELNEQAIAKPHDRSIREELAALCRELNEPKLAEMWQLAAESLRSKSSVEQ